MRLPGEDREVLLSDRMMWDLLGKWGYDQVREAFGTSHLLF